MIKNSPSITLPADPPANHPLKPDFSQYLAAGISANTRRAYRSDLRHFLGHGGCIPASVEMLARYITRQAGIVKASTLDRRLVSIGRAHTSQGFPNPCTNDLIRTVVRGVRRVHGTACRQVAPILREDLLLMVGALAGSKGDRDRALLLLGFAGAFRRSELVSLDVSDLEFVDRGLLVTLRRSKTDQEGATRRIAIPFGRGRLCPVRAVQKWMEAAGIVEGPIFRPITRHDRVAAARLSGHAVAKIIKQRAAAVGLDPNKFSGHSLRVGLITSAAKMGVSLWKIKAQSGHRTDAMVSRYVRDADLFNDNAAGAVL